MDDIMEQVSENEESTLKLMQIIDRQKKQLDTISTFIRTHTYSIELERTKEKTYRLDLTDEEWNDLLKLVEE